MIELLAPARDADIAIEAILSGADAVYIGAPSHGARQAASNSIADIARVVEVAHRYNARVYATVNTVIFDNEIPGVEKLIRELYRAGVDALIVQDMAVLRMNIPPVDLHASTQCDIRDAGRARFLRSVGFSRVVLARELSEKEIAGIHREVPSVELEAFCHGALCVSYSGDCRASFLTTGRSANRGECAQICRLAFDLTDSAGNVLVRNAHLLSLRDLNRLSDLKAMAEAGVTSFKIEGRLKDSAYVRNTVAAYSRQLTSIASPENPRSSCGTSYPGFEPDVCQSFNRGFTSYFFRNENNPGRMAAIRSPKWTGAPVGKVAAIKGNTITLRLTPGTILSNGDGLTFFSRSNRLEGFRVNRAEGNRITVQEPVGGLEPGTEVYRNFNKSFDDRMKATAPRRTLWADMTLRYAAGAGVIALDAEDEAGRRVTATALLPSADLARSEQTGARRKILSKTGDTHFTLRNLDDRAGQIFIPASVLADLRRRTLALLESAGRATYRFRYRLPEETDARCNASLTIHDNVTNRLARKFYEQHGAVSITPGVEELAPSSNEEVTVMTTRYCVRRELGMCLKHKPAVKGPLRLKAPGIDLRLDFDCAACRMNVVSERR